MGQISETYDRGRIRAMQAVNTQLVETYWEIGRYIVEFEQQGEAKAEYSKALLTNLSKDLTIRLGKGFSRSNLTRFRQFYLVHPNCATVLHNLTWSHMGYFANEENVEGDNPPIGLILTRNKDELLVEYATYQMNSQLFVQK
ncbi:PDDEXK nuclease domain-containing protein [Leptolyngbya boryana CZ1]|uniref:PDDEXK nuclease domain-containing protein n=1 Tax=Leptolyngbya boryana CZ1 TaxID=3060204 RepID=A0AA96WQM5_LEPBY|nr:DUF1016 N-terminal domain-containing protein [Leptolyngbya boryana]WNZ44052.1 PDDEXK nuclease domain-containing protein [Leptolyngbya boryana CZ1]